MASALAAALPLGARANMSAAAPPDSGMGLPTIAGFAVVGKANNPLYAKSFGSEDHLKFQFIVHTALDIVDERGEPRWRAPVGGLAAQRSLRAARTDLRPHPRAPCSA